MVQSTLTRVYVFTRFFFLLFLPLLFCRVIFWSLLYLPLVAFFFRFCGVAAAAFENAAAVVVVLVGYAPHETAVVTQLEAK
jgi:hypothetical protein